jgi:HAMP domain-containing protein
VRPIRRIARIADEVSLGNMSGGEFPGRGSPELVGLAHSFNRMRTSLSKALKLLED